MDRLEVSFAVEFEDSAEVPAEVLVVVEPAAPASVEFEDSAAVPAVVQRVALVDADGAFAPADEDDSPGHSTYVLFPSAGPSPSAASSFEADHGQSVHSANYAHTSFYLCNIFSRQGPHNNKNRVHICNKPSHDHNKGNDTICFPSYATTSRSRNTNLCQDQE